MDLEWDFELHGMEHDIKLSYRVHSADIENYLEACHDANIIPGNAGFRQYLHDTVFESALAAETQRKEELRS